MTNCHRPQSGSTSSCLSCRVGADAGDTGPSNVWHTSNTGTKEMRNTLEGEMGGPNCNIALGAKSFSYQAGRSGEVLGKREESFHLTFAWHREEAIEKFMSLAGEVAAVGRLFCPACQFPNNHADIYY